MIHLANLPGDWVRDALCAQTDPEAFFPENGSVDGARQARRVCQACDVRAECLEWALSVPEQDGILGGTNRRERGRLRAERARRAQAAPEPDVTPVAPPPVPSTPTPPALAPAAAAPAAPADRPRRAAPRRTRPAARTPRVTPEQTRLITAVADRARVAAIAHHRDTPAQQFARFAVLAAAVYGTPAERDAALAAYTPVHLTTQQEAS